MSEIKIGDYIIKRLVQLGTRSIQGVPGDFNMAFLDLIEDSEDVVWVGNANELNAAYSADGYSRIKGTVAALVTTFGVGELSAINGVAGAFSERVPVVHIVGVPSTSAQGAHSLLHHTLGDGRFGAFANMSKEISQASTLLQSPDGAAQEVDRVLTIAARDARPVYIALPTDLVHKKISSKGLATPLSVEVPANDEKAEKYVLNVATKHIEDAKRAVILVDACAIRHHCIQETKDLIEKSGLPVFSTPMGKTAIDEDHAQYGGIYVGSITSNEVRQIVERSDVLITVGALKSDFNTGNFTYRTPKESTVELHTDHTTIGYSHYPGIGMKGLLPKLAERLSRSREKRLKVTKQILPKFDNILPQDEGEDKETITQAYFWPRMGKFFRPKDQIIVETGTSSFGMLEAKLPRSSMFVAQILWGSIGWSVGATLGVALAAREEKLGKTCLFVGDGSLQLTAQEIGTMIRQGLKPFLFVLSNDGYEIERQIHGPERVYNNIAPWNHSLLLDLMSAPTSEDVTRVSASHKCDPKPSKKKYYAVRTKNELDQLLDDPTFNAGKEIQLIEVFMKRGDAPTALKRQAQATSCANKYE
ncbi:putative PDC1-pyruvate decarboxylase, isozyme 1 [Violaceomyces palustris]|uniref:PDC1-pyruvate decarboxylase, isozyme 1 n=1 Tax=Violaceomyces palustris TaxID=1673888 RepID=A0ACD0NP35_9BASI|nr:putative PDC1-pyruvate decarboxylase, isozyme 1 [Violaceomyces palustris]